MNQISACLLTNAAYAAPTAVVAGQIAAFNDPAIADVYFVWVEAAPPPQELVRYLALRNIKLVVMPSLLLKQVEGLGSGRLPGAAFARMLLAQVLEDTSIGRFVYLDGDVDVRKTLGPLADLNLPRGHIATADGYQAVISTQSPAKKAKWDSQIAKLGLLPREKYFNNGVIVCEMEDWEKIGPEALDFFLKNREICPFLDQDALNAICRDRRSVLSPRYNFQRAYFAAGVFEEVDPAIVHYHGDLKPWAATPGVWTWNSRRDFEASFSAMPDLWKITPPRNKSMLDKTKMHGGAVVKVIKERIGEAKLREEFRGYFANSHFVDLVT